MHTKLRQLRDIFELAVTENFQFKGSRQFCKIAENCDDDELALDFYTKQNYYYSNKPTTTRRFRKNLKIGDFWVTDYGIVYQHTHYKPSYLSRIKNYLRDSVIEFKQIGDYLYFESQDAPLPEKEPLHVGASAIMVRLPVTDIKGVFVPSTRTNRIFIISTSWKVYAENRVKGKTIYDKLRKTLTKDDHLLTIDFETIPMLMLAKFNHSFEDLEQIYSEKMVKALTT